MNPPPVQYVTTSDGYSIAYAVSGTGSPLVVAPAIWNHVQNSWLPESPFGRTPTLHTWAKRFQVIAYDSRGQGMSQRGLAALVSKAWLIGWRRRRLNAKLTSRSLTSSGKSAHQA
jgi:hypothetical protein